MVSDGQRFEPRLARQIENVVTRERRVPERVPQTSLDFQPEHTALIREAMYGVTQEGTSTRVFAGAGYTSGGKTGTAQAVGLRQNEKYVASRVEEYRRDHSLYEAFAPVENPRVALAIIVENAGFGSAAAAPIARRVLDYLLQGIYPSEEDILAVQQGRAAAPIGVPRVAAEVPLPPRRNAFDVEDEVALPTAAASTVGAASVPVRASAPLAPPSAPSQPEPPPSAPAPSGAALVAPAASREQP